MKYSYKVADMTIHRIVEYVSSFEKALAFLPDLTQELLAENRAWLHPEALDDNDMFRLWFQCYIIETPHHTVLVDSCVGNDKHRPGWPEWNMRSDDSFLRGLAQAGFTVEDIDYVMCTHLHADHVGWNTQLKNGRWTPTFPNARYIFWDAEYSYWAEENNRKEVPTYVDSILPVVEAGQAEIIQTTHGLGDHLRIFPTPGHTAGHVSFCFGKNKDDVVVCGDIMHVPLQMKYPELSLRGDADKVQAAITRRSFLERYCDTSTLCCTAHFPAPSLGHISRLGNGFSMNYLKNNN